MEAEEVYAALNKKIKSIQASGGGVTDYKDLDGKPQINGVTLQGNLTAADLDIHEFSGSYEDLQGAPASLPNPHPVTFGGMLPLKTYDGSKPVSVTFPDVEILNETAGTPVGEIISFMGTIAPVNYLICDGTLYSIADYPYLAQHFIENFGSVNFFGGDGETTFAVPDLRGEFLRGYGTNSHSGQGSGESVGAHQDATVHNNVRMWSDNSRGYIYAPMNANVNTTGHFGDTIISRSTNEFGFSFNTKSGVSGEILGFTSRPTNTSVLFLIKYKPTYYLKAEIINGP